MDSMSLVAAATDMSQVKTETAVQLAVFKKAMDVQAQGALQLIQATAQVIPNNPPHLGNQVDIFT